MISPANLVLDTRRRLGLTQAQFAQLVGVHWVTVAKWEKGVLRPSPHQAAMIARFREAAYASSDKLGPQLAELIIAAGAVAAVFLLLKLAFEKKG